MCQVEIVLRLEPRIVCADNGADRFDVKEKCLVYQWDTGHRWGRISGMARSRVVKVAGGAMFVLRNKKSRNRPIQSPRATTGTIFLRCVDFTGK